MADGNLALPPPIAPLWRRALARVIDLAFLGVVAVGALYVANKAGLDALAFPNALLLVVLVIYEVLVPKFSKGASIGRFVTRTRLYRESGEGPPSIGQYLARLTTRVALLSIFAVFIAYELGFDALYVVLVVEAIACTLSSKRQTVADLVARTVVTTHSSLAKGVA
jgi:uncharacterized RDD family membrane protein YckC